MNRLQPALSGIAVQGDVFDHHDGIIDDQAHGRRESAERHQVEAFVQQLQSDERYQHRSRNHQRRHQRGSPVAKEKHHDERGENQADENGVAYALDGLSYDLRLVVEGLELDAGWKRLLDTRNLGVYRICDRNGIAVGLARDVEQHRRLLVSSNDGIHRFDAGLDRGNVLDTNRHACGRGLYDDVADLLRILYLGVD